jgi:hypothetical protein
MPLPAKKKKAPNIFCPTKHNTYSTVLNESLRKMCSELGHIHAATVGEFNFKISNASADLSALLCGIFNYQAAGTDDFRLLRTKDGRTKE